MIRTITVNQWHIKHNAENPHDLKPVICCNVYYSAEVVYDEYGNVKERRWGKRIGTTEHFYSWDILGANVSVIYDPVNKTPCGASCWMQEII